MTGRGGRGDESEGERRTGRGEDREKRVEERRRGGMRGMEEEKGEESGHKDHHR